MATTAEAAAFHPIEEEVILLRACVDLIDDMLNHQLMELRGDLSDTEVYFRTDVHQRLFNILLVDFLSRTDRQIKGLTSTSYMGALRAIAATPNFDEDGSVVPLRESVGQFVDWLEAEVDVQAWFPTLNADVTLRIKRVQSLKMCGDLAKHNILRVGGVAADLIQALKQAVPPVQAGMHDALLALEQFYERFHDDILNYHGSSIAEFLNNIRWGIHSYLQPELKRSVRWEKGGAQPPRFDVPATLATPLSQACYWELMNQAMRSPRFPKFEVSRFLNLRY